MKKIKHWIFKNVIQKITGFIIKKTEFKPENIDYTKFKHPFKMFDTGYHKGIKGVIIGFKGTDKLIIMGAFGMRKCKASTPQGGYYFIPETKEITIHFCEFTKSKKP